MSSGDPAWPTDEAILSQENEIRAGVSERQNLGLKEPLTELAKEYASGSQVFQTKIRQLAATYPAFRRARGDGNCFFRSFLCSFLEDLMLRTSPDEQSMKRAVLHSWRSMLVECGFQELVFEDALEALLDLVQQVSAPDPISLDDLAARLSDESMSSYCIMLLRMITSCELQRRSQHFSPFVISMQEEGMTVQDFCRRHVEPMGEESDHLHLVAMADALQTPMRVVYLDNAVGADGCAVVNHHDFIPEGMAVAVPQITMLYRPGHYDILYTV
mmetsp:Transcript_26454/g.50235  ORF Transcript_26454/g.50235 Transcript_26454/m.50235 type:complete len:272 (-) Transcript_26454:287-1102(-)